MLVLVIAAGVGAYVGSLMGAMSHMRGGGRVPREAVRRESRDSGVLVAVHVSPETQQQAAHVLLDSGGLEIESNARPDAGSRAIGPISIRRRRWSRSPAWIARKPER